MFRLFAHFATCAPTTTFHRFFFTVDRVEGVETCTMGRCAKEQQMVRKELKVCLLVLAIWFIAGTNKEAGLLSQDGTAFAVSMESPAGKRHWWAVKSEPADIDDLKKGIKDEESLTVRVSKMDIYYRTDGKWQKEEKMSNALRPSTEEQPYGYVVP